MPKAQKNAPQMSQMQIGGRGYLVKPTCLDFGCPKYPREGGGQQTLGQCPKVYSFFILKASLSYLLHYSIQVDWAIFFHRLYFGEIIRCLPPLRKILVTPLHRSNLVLFANKILLPKLQNHTHRVRQCFSHVHF